MRLELDTKVIGNKIKQKVNGVKEGIADTATSVVKRITPERENFCSRCGFDVQNYGKIKYCPGCGKKW